MELETAESTQDEARSNADRAAPVLVVAARQPGGRGRLGRSWVEPDRALFSSLAFEPTWPAAAWTRIPLVAGLAVRDAVEDLYGISVGLRWPNDLMVAAGKVGGILVESGDSLVVVGCGINVQWSTPMAGAAALFDRAPDAVAPRELAVAWADRFLDRMGGPPDPWGADDYRNVCVTIGRQVSYDSGTGIATGISNDGALLVETVKGEFAVTSAEVRLHDPATLHDDRRGV